jgi:hypothetical protein
VSSVWSKIPVIAPVVRFTFMVKAGTFVAVSAPFRFADFMSVRLGREAANGFLKVA